MFLALRSAVAPRAPFLLAAACFAFGFAAAAVVPSNGPLKSAADAARPVRAAQTISHAGHPAEVLRVMDGDTFEARVHVWPGMDITTKVRLRGIDAPELHARCEDERMKALAARDALTRILDEGGVGITEVGQDKYGGRVDAVVSTAETADVSEALLAAGYARRYAGGRRSGWCN
ncbi:MAG TPA: thermonuclease family protein [Pseudolabrys sp.]|nr:thermonuclease family protein [Pseudolabrys sp.]